jgi:hypothetical protein
MSHFCMLVVTDSPEESAIEEAMQPYHEYECTGVMDQYVEWIDEHDEYMDEYEDAKNTVEVICKDGKFLCTKYSREAKPFWSRQGDGIYTSTDKIILPEGYEIVEVPYYVYYKTFEEFMENYHGFGDDNWRDGRVGCLTNPNSKWDWWEIGGRWSDHLRHKDGTYGDSFKKADVDFDFVLDEAGLKAATEYDYAMKIADGRDWKSWEEIRKTHDGNMDTVRKKYHDQEVIRDFKKAEGLPQGFFFSFDEFKQSRDEYILKRSVGTVGTFGVLMDNEWIESGNMGWFGCVSDEDIEWARKFLDLIKQIPDDKYLTVVDCHI